MARTRRSAPAPRPWRRYLLAAALALTGVLLGFGVPYLLVVDAKVRAGFGKLVWQLPTRVYARPLELAPGRALNIDALEAELQAARYREDSEAATPGSYARRGARFEIATRGFRDRDGPVAERRFSLSIEGGRVRELRDRDGQPLPRARIDPARIATLYGIAQEERELIRIEQAPELLVTTLQAVEDRDFKHHRGVDPWAILRAAWVNLRSGEIEQGGSTLTQQLVRNLFLDRGVRWTRKLDEAAHALVIEARFDKQRILEAYLNQVYLGQDGGQAVHGVSAGSWFWFAREPADLGAAEIALLVGLIRGPSYYDPRRHPERALARRNRVLEQMHATGLIDAAALASSSAAPLGVSARPGVARNRHPAFLELVTRQLAAEYPEDALSGAGLSVMTTLEPSTQELAEAAVAQQLAALDAGAGVPLQAGLVVSTIDAEVAAVVGGRDPRRHGFNRALSARRPIGSLVKPFVYLLALAQPGRWSLASWLQDRPVSVPLPRGEFWEPENFDGESHGDVRLIEALSKSYNQATVRLGLEIGVERLARLLQALAGLEPPAHPSLLLGSLDLSPLEATQVYQFLASGGRLEQLRSVRAVLDAEGEPLSRFDREPTRAEDGDAIASRLVTLALQRTAETGTASRLSREGLGWLHPAGKTGTSNDHRDSWFAGYTGAHLAVVWVGNDDNKPTGLVGASGAMRVWSTLFRGLPTEPLAVADDGLEWAWVAPEDHAVTDPDCEGAERFAFVRGFTPREYRRCGWSRWRNWFDREERR